MRLTGGARSQIWWQWTSVGRSLARKMRWGTLPKLRQWSRCLWAAQSLGRLEQPPAFSVPPDGYSHSGKKESPVSFAIVAVKFKHRWSRSKSQTPSKGFAELNPDRASGAQGWVSLRARKELGFTFPSWGVAEWSWCCYERLNIRSRADLGGGWRMPGVPHVIHLETSRYPVVMKTREHRRERLSFWRSTMLSLFVDTFNPSLPVSLHDLFCPHRNGIFRLSAERIDPRLRNMALILKY